MSLSWCFCSTKYPSPSPHRNQKFTFRKPTSTLLYSIVPKPRNLSSSRRDVCINGNRDHKPEVQDLTKWSILRGQNMTYTRLSSISTICFNGSPDYEPSVQDFVEAPIPRWQNMLSFAASLYPVYVTIGGIVACINPSAFLWFVKRGPFSYSFSLGLIMLAMGLTLELRDLLNLFKQRPLSVSASTPVISQLCNA